MTPRKGTSWSLSSPPPFYKVEKWSPKKWNIWILLPQISALLLMMKLLYLDEKKFILFISLHFKQTTNIMARAIWYPFIYNSLLISSHFESVWSSSYLNLAPVFGVINSFISNTFLMISFSGPILTMCVSLNRCPYPAVLSIDSWVETFE